MQGSQGANALGALNGLPLNEALQVITQAIHARRQLALPVINQICPTIVFPPSRLLMENRFFGKIKIFNVSKGYGFISCPEVHNIFRCDVFLHKAQAVGFTVDQFVSFAVMLSTDNRPQAFDLQVAAAPPVLGQAQPLTQRQATEGMPAPPRAEPSSSSSASPCLAAGLPIEQLQGQRFTGRIKSFSPHKGFGFITNEELFAHFRRDVYAHYTEIGELELHSEVSFELMIKGGNPQARAVRKVEKQQAASSSSPPEAVGADAAPAIPDSLFDRVNCVICQEVMHKATSIQPCMHSFCRACILIWFVRSCTEGGGGEGPHCPICRVTPQRVAPNCDLENIATELLKAHPGRRRDEEDLSALEAGHEKAVQDAARLFQLQRIPGLLPANHRHASASAVSGMLDVFMEHTPAFNPAVFAYHQPPLPPDFINMPNWAPRPRGTRGPVALREERSPLDQQRWLRPYRRANMPETGSEEGERQETPHRWLGMDSSLSADDDAGTDFDVLSAAGWD